jgi:hypothetical protein
VDVIRWRGSGPPGKRSHRSASNTSAADWGLTSGRKSIETRGANFCSHLCSHCGAYSANSNVKSQGLFTVAQIQHCDGLPLRIGSKPCPEV